MDNYKAKYLKYKFKYLNLKNNNLIQNTQLVGGGAASSKTTIYLFKAEWCPHCVGFKPTWEKIQKDFKGKYEFVTVDSEKDKEIITKWDIKGFPTIIKKSGSVAQEYIGTRDEMGVKTFIEEN